MSNSYRIRTQVGVDKSIRVLLDQDFEYLEILSLKILQNQIYTRRCSDYGVVIGRVVTNGGFGIPNAKVSIFIPLNSEDESNPIISDLYPYKTLSDLNEDGYRYNLLPYVKSHGGHTPTGTFFDRLDVLVDPPLIQVFDTYFRYTARTNDSGDFMIFGVPIGEQTIHVDVDLSDIGEFSLSPQDLIRMGVASEAQVAGTKFKSSNNLGELPQIVTINRTIEVEPLWGEEDVCNIGITRTDFDLSDEANITIQPTAIFMGSIVSDTDRLALKRNCRPKFIQGELCNLVAGPGEILAIRQTIRQDINGRPELEVAELQSGGQIIDDNGTWLLDVPMNLDYVITNEFGEQVLSDDPKKGIPTKGKYRFKIKWNQSPSLSENVKRGYFLVPNVREYGWGSTGGTDPLSQSSTSASYQLAEKSYAFSLDWNDYADIQAAINCEDTFYEMKYNKVYSVSQMIDQFRRGLLPNRFVAVKNILDDTCESENNRFPTNDSSFRMDIIFLLYLFAQYVFRPILYALIPVIHVLYAVIEILKYLLPLLAAYMVYLGFNAVLAAATSYPSVLLIIAFGLQAALYFALGLIIILVWVKLLELELKPINLPILLYDSCEFCDCKDPDTLNDGDYSNSVAASATQAGAAPIPVPSPDGLIITNFNENQYFLNLTSSNPLYTAIGSLMTGKPFQTQPTSTPTCSSLVPGLETATTSSGDKYWFLTTNLTITERINLFNTKAKYFDSSPLNPGGGVNRIKTSFQPGSGNEHYDNIVFLMLKQGAVINAGDIITFQDPKLSKDKNMTGLTQDNQFGTTSITGTTTNTTYTKTIYYADYTNPNAPLIPVNYSLQGDSGSTTYHKYPIDIEYFQVVTAMTYSSFSSQCGNTLPESLKSRFLANTTYYLRINDNVSGGFKNEATFNQVVPLTSYDKYQNQICVFLVRGVDPYSPRQTVEYDLSRIFGYSSYGIKVVTGNYKLNQPIYGGIGPTDSKFLNVKHNLTSNDAVDTTYSNSELYFENFTYYPDTSQFLNFSSNLPSYYSNLDNQLTSVSFTSPCTCPASHNVSQGSSPDTTYGRKVNSTPIPYTSGLVLLTDYVSMTTEYDLQFTTPLTPFITVYTPTFNNTANSGGYYPDEIVEGGSLMVMSSTIRLSTAGNPTVTTSYISSTYPSFNLNYPTSIASNRKLVMRSDRLPASTQNLSNCGTSYLLHANSSFAMFKISDNGYIQATPQQPNPSMSQGTPDPTTIDSSTVGNDLIDSLNDCSKSVPLKCYSFTQPSGPNSGEFVVNHGSCEEFLGNKIFKGGCYQLITKILLSLLKDWELLTEWLARTNITFGACRNVFSHSFRNNWINGTMYAFAFKNNRIFDSNNQPSSQYCKKVVHLVEKTSTFYYRSSPYYSAGPGSYFCGDATSGSGPQTRNLKYPTTMIDLGPRSFYLQELIMSDDYDGYVVNKLNTTTFGDVQDLLNMLIISRLANSNLLQQILGVGGANIFSYFDKRGRGQVDADYAQMISINSELGVAEFESENYPAITPGQDPIYFNSGDVDDAIFGIFFSSDTQVRDFITPKRTIIVPSAATTSLNCAFNYFNVFSQEVPFYQWETNPNTSGFDSIFGSQSNSWRTDPISGGAFFSLKYQSLDRISASSRYFRSNSGVGNMSYFRGYIFSVTPTGGYEPSQNTQIQNSSVGRAITVGAPYHFYFGLKKGKSAWDRFARKWIDFEVTVD